MIAVYAQTNGKSTCDFRLYHKGTSSADAIKEAITSGKVKPGELALTIHLTDKYSLNNVPVIKHWAIYVRHGEVEAMPDRAGVMMKAHSYKYYRKYLKMGRVRSLYYKIRKKVV